MNDVTLDESIADSVEVVLPKRKFFAFERNDDVNFHPDIKRRRWNMERGHLSPPQRLEQAPNDDQSKPCWTIVPRFVHSWMAFIRSWISRPCTVLGTSLSRQVSDICEIVDSKSLLSSVIRDEDTEEMLLRESAVAEAKRLAEDAEAGRLVASFFAQLERDGNFVVAFNPARDGDCLMKCAVQHDLTEAGQSASKSGTDDFTGACTLTANELRTKVVARVRENSLRALTGSAAETEAVLAAPTSKCCGADALQKLEALQQAASAVEERCALMGMPGVVMGEDELQALADVRGAPVKVLWNFYRY